MTRHPMPVVPLRGPDTSMSEQPAHCTDVGSFEEQAGRKSVTKTVRVARVDFCRFTDRGNRLPEGGTPPLEAAMPAPEELRRIAGKVAQRLRRLRFKADLEGLSRFLSAPDGEVSVADVATTQLSNVGDPQAGVQQDEYQRLAHRDADLVLIGSEIARGARRRDDALNLPVGEWHGPGAVVDRVSQVASGVLGAPLHPLSEPEQGAQALGLQPHGSGGAGARVAPHCKIGRQYRLDGAITQGGAQIAVNHPAAAERR